jgi:hypothetical protein
MDSAINTFYDTLQLKLENTLHKVHSDYRMVNAGRVNLFNRVPTLCNQLVSHLLANILQTLHSCIDILKMCMGLFGSIRTFFENVLCS